MRKRILIGALLGVLSVCWPGRSAGQDFKLGPAVLPQTTNQQFTTMQANSKPKKKPAPPPSTNPIKKVTDFMTTPIIKVAAFVGVRKTETKPAYQVRRERMYQQRRELHRDELMKMKSPR